MQSLLHQRCFNHAMREAVARCPDCTRFFCRECITEHDDRVLCSACLKKLARTPLAKRPAFVKLVRFAQCAVAVMITWFFFFVIGEMLLRIPTTFHEGTLWQVRWRDKE